MALWDKYVPMFIGFLVSRFPNSRIPSIHKKTINDLRLLLSRFENNGRVNFPIIHAYLLWVSTKSACDSPRSITFAHAGQGKVQKSHDTGCCIVTEVRLVSPIRNSENPLSIAKRSPNQVWASCKFA